MRVSKKASEALSKLSLDFKEGWGQGPVFEWYKKLSRDESSIDRLEIRFDKNGMWHRFVVLYMKDNTVHRFDRRPEAINTWVGLNSPVETRDECIRGLDKEGVEEVERADCEIELLLDGKVDLKVVLSACFAISKTAKDYTVLEHNCFFFSWTILMVTSRYSMPYDHLEPGAVLNRIKHHIPRLTSSIVDDITRLLVNIVAETVSTFKITANEAVYRGMSPLARAVANFPTPILRFFCRRTFSARLYMGLRRQLQAKVKEMLEGIAVRVTRGALLHSSIKRLLAERLWLSDLNKIVSAAIQMELIGILWSAVFDALCKGFGEVNMEDVIQSVHNSRSRVFRNGSRPAQFFAVWNAALHGGLCSARDLAKKEEAEVQQEREDAIRNALREDPDDPNRGLQSLFEQDEEYLLKLSKQMFDRAWSAAAIGAKREAQHVVEKTKGAIESKFHGERERMWQAVWDIWDDTWDRTQRSVRTMSIETLKSVVSQILAAGCQAVLDELNDAKAEGHSLKARILRDKTKRQENHRMTNRTIQELMQKIMEKYTVNGTILDSLHSTMSQVWVHAHNLPPLQTVESMDTMGGVGTTVNINTS
ncbi:hypothetical protein VNI00_001549 [Paramarasmius palmivorus]|uniref:Uncharacterized protein n=1 Tax=Paramarasmius palmivorus TaxID=297713 RepID=A0AAW0E6M7_9AGAR